MMVDRMRLTVVCIFEYMRIKTFRSNKLKYNIQCPVFSTL